MGSPVEVVGNLTIDTPEYFVGPKRFGNGRYNARCKCGATVVISDRRLKQLRTDPTTSCKACCVHDPKHHPTRKDCRVCDDCPALRPSNGTPCKCGLTKGDR